MSVQVVARAQGSPQLETESSVAPWTYPPRDTAPASHIEEAMMIVIGAVILPAFAPGVGKLDRWRAPEFAAQNESVSSSIPRSLSRPIARDGWSNRGRATMIVSRSSCYPRLAPSPCQTWKIERSFEQRRDEQLPRLCAPAHTGCERAHGSLATSKASGRIYLHPVASSTMKRAPIAHLARARHVARLALAAHQAAAAARSSGSSYLDVLDELFDLVVLVLM